MTKQISVSKVNSLLGAKKSDDAIKVFEKEIGSNLNYMFDKKPDFVKRSVLDFFSSLAKTYHSFTVVIGPRRKRTDGSFEHPTYHIGFNNKDGRHFCDFKLKFIREKYYKMSFPLPTETFLDKKLEGFSFSKQRQSSSDYITIRLDEKVTAKDYEDLAKIAREVGSYYER